MQKFHFPLETALQFRQMQVDLNKAHLERLYAELTGLYKREQQCHIELEDANQVVKAGASTFALNLLALDNFSRHIDSRRHSLEKEKSGCIQRIAEQQTRLRRLQADAKLLVKLKERKLAEWKAQEGREQEALAGELYLAAWPGRAIS